MPYRVLLAALLAVAVIPAARAADQTVLGRTLVLKDPSTPERRRITVTARETATEVVLVGDPVAAGATVTVAVEGASPGRQTFVLPGGTSPTSGRPFWKGDPVKGFTYRDPKNENGPVERARIRVRRGAADVQVVISGRGGLVSVVPPDPGTGGCVLLALGGGDSYSIAFTTGRVTNRGSRYFAVSRPTAEGSCLAGVTTTTTSSTTTTTQCAAGTPIAGQTPGDCRTVVCDGAGGTTSVVDDLDVPADGACGAGGTCTGGVPAFTMVEPPMTRCAPDGGPGLVCDGAGACVECLTAADCTGGDACVANRCLPCAADAECGAGRTCTAGVCSALRYRDLVFDTAVTTSDLVYGSAVSQQGETVTLRLDAVEPVGDPATGRPAIVWVHGGGFAAGDKTSPEIVDQMHQFARKGYFNVSITYRLSPNGCFGPVVECVTAMIHAMHDAMAAVRWVRANAAAWRVDPDRIAISGTSAGAITALNVGYNPDDPGDSGNPGFSSAVGAAVSFSGARLLGVPDPGEPPSLLFHGTLDPLVPYAWAVASVDQARAVGITALLTTWVGAGHVPYLEHRTEILDQTTTFLYWSLDLAHAAP